MNFTFGKVILGVILAFEQVNWCKKWRRIRNFGDLSLFFEKLYNENYKLNMSIVLSSTNNNFWAVFIDLNLAHK